MSMTPSTAYPYRRLVLSLAVVTVTAAATVTAAHADTSQAPQIPTCDKKLGTLAVNEPQDPWWTAMQLDSPAALIKVYVAQSKCFTLVDRGKGLAAAQAERALAASGEERAGSNIGKGQMKAADYVLVPDIANRNRNSGGTNVGGMLGGLLPHGIGALAGGISLKSKTADVVLTLTDVRSTEQVALEQGHAKKTDLGWMGGGGGVGFFGGFAAAGASSYANTEIGQVVATAYADAYAKLVADVKAQAPDAKADNVQQAVSMAKPGKMYTNSDLKSAVVRDLDPGMMLYPTGDKMGVWWKVTDELGNAGWVVSTNFKLAH
ncbi:MAG TPA: CsgG/HfaB family protein [Steroidobacteraceae bacterium]|nr:CsgG/HfaB family protein [Steroidobacteraceae bacterium]